MSCDGCGRSALCGAPVQLAESTIDAEHAGKAVNGNTACSTWALLEGCKAGSQLCASDAVGS